MAVATDGTRHLTSLQREYRKQYFVYDVDGNPTYVYEARPLAEDGDPCLVTKYEWDTGKLFKSIEYEGVWSVAFDLAVG